MSDSTLSHLPAAPAAASQLHPRWLVVSAGLLAHVVVVVHLWLAMAGGVPWWQWIVAVVLAWWFVDVLTLFIHWLLDNFFEPDSFLVGKTVYFFREHHRAPHAMFDRSYFDSNFENALFSAGVLVAAALLPLPAVGSVFFAVAGLGGAYITTVHKWAHDPRPPRLVAVMQRLGALVSPAHHSQHHQDTRGHYALFAGHMEPLVEGLRLFELGELLAFLLTGTTAVETRLELGRRGERPSLRDRWERLYWRSWYSFLAWYSQRRGAHFTCMNWGYDDPDVPDDSAEAHALGAERYPLQLYRALAEGLDLTGGMLVDISCGRGGGVHWLHTHHHPSRTLGVDFTPGNITHCQTNFPGVPRLRFQRGDAEAMPLQDGSVRALLSVEASHCYPHPERFLAEAARVLEPGGWLLWTDFRPSEELAALRAQIPEALELVVEQDITPRVISAMAKDGPRRQALIAEHTAPLLRGVMAHFAAADESAETVQRFKSGAAVYFFWRLRRRAV